ncbi:ABC transporter ATP-binding protein [Micromonospora sp. NPDC050417]|uniref:ABC transporter ATP-binding protein n=1 Tax=Micromonospora sp. NPDC050417 TaxID=3364280 RepID=UPI00378B7F4F
MTAEPISRTVTDLPPGLPRPYPTSLPTTPPEPRTREFTPGLPDLRASDLTLGYDGVVVVDGLEVAIPAGRITVIVGANACGKSTLLQALARLLAPRAGSVRLDGASIQSMPTRQVARKIGILPQSPVAPPGLTVIDLVTRGRAPHQTWWRQWSTQDEQAVTDALASTNMLPHAHRPVDELSGGQRQRAWIAMAIAQETPVLLLDEPTTFLDLAHQIDVLDLIVDLNRQENRTVVMVLHDLNQASRYADHLIAMKAGQIVRQGSPAEVITTDLVEQVFDLDCQVDVDPVTGTPMIIPMGRHHQASPAPVGIR